MSTTSKTALQFLQELFVRDMSHAIESGLHYYAFPLLCQGIELMGSYFDRHPIDERNHGKARFSTALDVLFEDKRYSRNKSALFEGLRGNMIHQLRPGAPYGLATCKHDGADPGLHLTTTQSGITVLVLEVLLEDFRKALRKLAVLIEKQDSRVDPMKVNSIFFSYGPLQG